jgi:hypothetical protein
MGAIWMGAIWMGHCAIVDLPVNRDEVRRSTTATTG